MPIRPERKSHLTLHQPIQEVIISSLARRAFLPSAVAGGTHESRKEHRVPLSGRAVAILDELHRAQVSDFVFPGFKRGCPLSNMALEAVG